MSKRPFANLLSQLESSPREGRQQSKIQENCMNKRSRLGIWAAIFACACFWPNFSHAQEKDDKGDKKADQQAESAEKPKEEISVPTTRSRSAAKRFLTRRPRKRFC